MSARKLRSRLSSITASVDKELSNFRNELENATALKKGDINNKTILDLRRKFEQFEKEVKNSLSSLKQDISLLAQAHDDLEQKSEDNLQKSYMKNIIIKGLPEEGGENLTLKVIDCLNNKPLEYQVLKSELNVCYRLGKKRSDNSSRLVVVEFLSQWKRDELFKLKRRLKGSGMFIMEMLTKSRLELYNECRKIYKNKCWSEGGKVLVMINNRINNIADIDQLQSLSN